MQAYIQAVYWLYYHNFDVMQRRAQTGPCTVRGMEWCCSKIYAVQGDIATESVETPQQYASLE